MSVLTRQSGRFRVPTRIAACGVKSRSFCAPATLAPFKAKCFALTIDPQRLNQIRNERRPNSKYASIENCRYEVAEAEAMMRREGIAWLSSTHKSIEEIATTILRDLQPDRLMY